MRISTVPCKVLDPRLYSLTIGSRPRDVWNRNTQVLGIHCEWSRQRSLVELVFCCGSQMICTNWESLDSQKYIFLLYQFNPHQVLYIFLLDAFTFFLGLWTVRMGLGNILGRGSTDTVGAGRKHWFRSSVASCLCHSLAIPIILSTHTHIPWPAPSACPWRQQEETSADGWWASQKADSTLRNWEITQMWTFSTTLRKALEGLTMKLKLHYFGHLIQRADSLEKTLMLGKIEGRRRRGWQRTR